MPREQTGSTYRTSDGLVGIRWREGSDRPHQPGFKNETEARRWFRKEVLPRLERNGPSARITFDEFCDLYLDARWGPTQTARTVATVRNWLIPARAQFGTWTMAELENAADDIAAWRAQRSWSEDQRHKRTRALRQVLAAAKRWRYIDRNPALDVGPNPQPRGEECDPFDSDELDAILAELGGGNPRDAAVVIVGAETGLRTNEWTASHRADVDRNGTPTLQVVRRFSEGVLTPYPKNARSLRSVPLTPRALAALDDLPPRIDSRALFPAHRGGYLLLNNWRNRTWTPALEAAGVMVRGPYHLRHTFASNALAAGIAPFMLARLMGCSIEMIDRRYGHLTRDWADVAYRLLAGVSSGAQG
jgi:integrase